MTDRDRAAGRFRGVIATPITPFRPDFSLDLDAVETNAACLLADGAAGFVVCGSIGELPTLTTDEWEAIVRRTVKAGGSAAPVFATVGHPDIRVVRHMAERAAEIGAVGVVAVPPYYYGLSRRELVAFYRDLDRVGTPFVVYSHPGTGRPDIDLAALEEIAALDRFAGLKEATASTLEYRDKRRLLAGRFNVLAAAESNLFDMACHGTDGCLTAVSTFAPGFLTRFLAAFDDGDLAEARAINDRLMAFRAHVHRQAVSGTTAYLGVTKAAVELAGLKAGPPRPPLLPLDADATRDLAETLSDSLGITTHATH